MRVAVVGAGNFGLKHLRALSSLPGVEPIAVPARPARLAELERDGVPALPSLAAARARACVIATSTGRHVADGLRAVSLGLDALVEKPLGVDAPSARRLARAARRRGRRVFVGCTLRFEPSLLRFRSLLPRLGRLHSVSAECRSYLSDWRRSRPYSGTYSARAAEGGVLRDLIHEIDYAGWLFGWPRAVSGRVLNLGRLDIASDELAELHWLAPKGFPVSVHVDYLTRPTRRGILACGEHGTLEWDALAQTVTLLPGGGKPRVWTDRAPADERLKRQAKAFLRAVSGGSRGTLATAEDGVRALAVCDAARRSSAGGRVEKVRYR